MFMYNKTNKKCIICYKREKGNVEITSPQFIYNSFGFHINILMEQANEFNFILNRSIKENCYWIKKEKDAQLFTDWLNSQLVMIKLLDLRLYRGKYEIQSGSL